jgi:ribosomal protein L11 methyltransferase
MQHTIVLTINNLSLESQEMLIALLADEGYAGFEESEGVLVACIAEELYDETITQEIVHVYSSEYTIEKLAPRNWNAEWEQQYQPVLLENFVAVRAHFHDPIPGVEYEIVITPKMSFGTGHHATTKQMMMAMRELSFENKMVFDYGTGTGVLAILASFLGAYSIKAMDIDDWCIENTIENLERNQVKNVSVLKGAEPEGTNQYDIILANINRHILLENMVNMTRALKTNGLLLMSGFYESDIPLLEKEAFQWGMGKISFGTGDSWSHLLMQKNKG